MKNVRIQVLAFVYVFVCLYLAACAIETQQDAGNMNSTVQYSGALNETSQNGSKPAATAQVAGDDTFKVEELSAKDLIEPVRGVEDASSRVASTGANSFAFELSAALSAQAGTENFICSPFSVWLPLAALVNATDAQNKPALLETLGAFGVSEMELNTAASRMLYDLTQQSYQQFASEQGIQSHNPLKIANAVFVGDNVTIKRDFAQVFLDYFRGSVISVDFSSGQAAEAVNAWASENTEGLISHIVEGFDQETVAALANAIYFSDRWGWEFDPDETTKGVFHSPAGAAEAFYMLREGDNLVYYEDDAVQATWLNFKTGGALYIILPKDGDANGLLSAMTGEYFSEIREDAILASGKLLLPRFSVESGLMQLADTLAALGAPLFDSATAPLTGGLVDEGIPVWLSSVLHRATIQVDEKGTTAAAVTVLQAPGGSMPVPTEPFDMTCDRPFVFILCSHTYDGGNQVLFTGIVNKP